MALQLCVPVDVDPSWAGAIHLTTVASLRGFVELLRCMHRCVTDCSKHMGAVGV